MSNSSATAFFDSWQTYRKVVAANYMHHNEIQGDIARLLEAQARGGGVSLLDLGCGDAATLAPLLMRLPIRHYKGIDLSEPALALAGDNLKSLSCPVELDRCDLLAALDAEAGRYNVVYSSFAVHHLSREQKAAFFRLAAARLTEGGVLLLTDVVREEDESLPVYLDRYCGRIHDDWAALDAAEKAAICHHIRSNDLPETFSELKALAAAAGLVDSTGVARYGWHHVASFRRGGAEI